MKHRFLLSILLICIGLGISSDVFAAEKRLIAVIMANTQPRYAEIHSTFVENSSSFCGADCTVYVQRPNVDTMSLRNSVRKAVALGAELIISYGPAATLAAKTEAPPVPTLFVDVYDPVRLKLVSEKGLTGRNMTGVRGDAPIQALFKYFLETTHARKLGIMYDLHSPEGLLQKTAIEESCNKKDVSAVLLGINNPKDHLTQLEKLPADIDGLYLASSEHSGSMLAKVLEWAVARQVPVITSRAGAAEQGAFMVLETSAAEQGEKLAEMAAQILSGTKTSEIPMYKPRQVAFVVNLKVAKQYGLQVPFQTLSLASRLVR